MAAPARQNTQGLQGEFWSPCAAQFRSRCAAILEDTALLLKTIVQESDSAVATVVQNAALSEGVLIRHFHSAVFSPSADQRFISRYLVELWMLGHTEGQALLRRMVPPGLVHFLKMPAVSAEQEQQLDELEARLFIKDEDDGRLPPAPTRPLDNACARC